MAATPSAATPALTRKADHQSAPGLRSMGAQTSRVTSVRPLLPWMSGGRRMAASAMQLLSFFAVAHQREEPDGRLHAQLGEHAVAPRALQQLGDAARGIVEVAEDDGARRA